MDVTFTKRFVIQVFETSCFKIVRWDQERIDWEDTTVFLKSARTKSGLNIVTFEQSRNLREELYTSTERSLHSISPSGKLSG